MCKELGTVVVHTFSSGTQEEEAGRSLSLKPAGSTEESQDSQE